jgi:hypothetical protein
VLFSRYLCSTRVKADATTAKLDGLETCIVGLTGAISRNGLAESTERSVRVRHLHLQFRYFVTTGGGP